MILRVTATMPVEGIMADSSIPAASRYTRMPVHNPPTDGDIKPRMQRRIAKLLAAGYALLTVLMLGLIAHAVWHIGQIEALVRDIVEARNLKIRLATDLQEAAYNRHNALVYQAIADDPFERDANFQLFIRWGYEVGKARNELKAMPLDTYERGNLVLQDELIAEISLLHEEISDLAARDDLEGARHQLTADLRPLNLELTEVIESLRRHERDQIHAALEEASRVTRHAIRLHLVLGGVLILLASAIGVFSHRQLARHTRTIFGQMTALEETGQRLEHEATHDPLTGLANRALFRRRLDEALAHAREEDFSLAVMYIDLDDFKPVNDIHGHAAGDMLLRAIADRLRGAVRVVDTIARLGGDEFAVLLTGLDRSAKCPKICDLIEQDVGKPVDLAGVVVSPACSVGHALYPSDGDTAEALLGAADARMYAIKRARKRSRGGQ